MVSGSPRRGLRWGTLVVVAGGVFGLLQWVQMSYQTPLTQGGTINPDASVEEVIQYMQSLPDLPQFDVEEITNTGQQGIAEKVEEDKEVEEDTNIVASSGQDVQDLDQMMGELINMGETHNTAQTNHQVRLNDLCDRFVRICDITTLDDSYTPEQQFAYQLMVVYVADKLREFGYDPLKSLETITINHFSASRRGYANARLVVINSYQMLGHKEFLQVLVHEMGHVVDLGVVRGTSRVINPDYTEFGKAKFAVDDQSLAFYAISWANENTLRSRMTNQDFVSGYGMSNPFEDFAECHNMYLYHRDVFARMAVDSRVLQQKYDYFDRMYATRILSANFNPTDLTILDVSFRPWDTTRM